VKKAAEMCRGEAVLVVNGDTFFDVPLKAMAEDHLQSGAELSVAVKDMKDCDRYGTVLIGETGGSSGFGKRGGERRLHQRRRILHEHRLLRGYPEAFSLEKQVMEEGVESHRMRAFPSDGYFIDIGIPDDYQRAQRDFARGAAGNGARCE
jgi:D-glycero-alpha-D-manno-heptose 1-phosphate guanylyltransferase